MSNWDYQREETPRLSPGDYRVAVVGVEEKTSKSGNEMIVISVQPSGSNIKIQQYIVKNEYFNRNMTSFFDSFNVEEGNFNFLTWIGAMGAAKLKEDENGYLKVAYFLDKKRAEKLPEWKGELPERQTISELPPNDDSELPFN